MTLPPWANDPPDHTEDATAYNVVEATTTDETVLHRACRHHNWQQSQTKVQTWTALQPKESKEKCAEEFWSDMTALGTDAEKLVTTHCRVHYLREDIKQGLLQAANPEALKRVVQELHSQWQAKAKPALWLAAHDELNQRYPFDSDHLHELVAALGLWHFGIVPGNSASGSVLRVTYRLPQEVELYKPDWRHGYPNFYFAVCPKEALHGLTRSLEDGELKCKEWIVPLEKIDAEKYIDSVSLVHPEAEQNHYNLPDKYWRAVAAEIHNARTAS